MVGSAFKTSEELKLFLIGSVEVIADVLKGIGHPKRLEILIHMLTVPKSFKTLMEESGLKKTALANHLTQLQSKKLIEKLERGLYCITLYGRELLEATANAYHNSELRKQIWWDKHRRHYSRLVGIDKMRRGIEMENRQILKGISKLSWGKECTFMGALEAALNFLGVSVDYVDLMGLSAAAFRLRFHQPEWCPSSAEGHFDPYPETAMKALGYQGQSVYKDDMNQGKIAQLIREEIDNGRPVVAIDLISPADWGVITGYVGDKLLCRTYHDKTEKRFQKFFNEIHGAERKDLGIIDDYNIADNFPWIIFAIKEIDSTPNRIESIYESLRLAVELVQKEKYLDTYANGFTAYNAWITNLENEDMFSKMDKKTFNTYWHINGWIYDSLHDARYTATSYLQRIEKNFSGKDKETIKQASAIFGDISKHLFKNWIHFPMPFWVKRDGTTWIPGDRIINENTWTKEMRIKDAEALKTAKLQEEEAYALLEKIV
ncbi:MAG: ArsR/SmtB family transcription factor [Candidatus Hodarchaeota archaeon]